MKKYFLYELKKRAFVIGCITLIATVIYLTPILTLNAKTTVNTFDSYLWLMSTIGGLTAVCLPLWLFDYKMTKRGLDLYYSLPLSHTKILLVRFLIGLITLFFSYTVAYWLGAFVFMAKFFGQIDAVWYLPQYFATLIPIYCIFAMSSFIFTRANKFIDGIVFIIFWAFAAALVAYVFDIIINNVNVYYYFPFSPLDAATTHFQEHLCKELNIHSHSILTRSLVNMILGFILTALLSAGATAGLFLLEKRAKAENAGQISESWFGYKVMLPLYSSCLAFASCSELMAASLLFIVMIAVGSFAVTVLYRRTIKIGAKQTLIYCVSLAAGIALFFITLGLGLVFHGI